MENLRLLKSFATEFEAEFIKTKLESEGIQSMIQAEDLANVLPSLDYSTGIRIYVEPEDFDRAQAFLEAPGDQLSEDMDTNEA